MVEYLGPGFVCQDLLFWQAWDCPINKKYGRAMDNRPCFTSVRKSMDLDLVADLGRPKWYINTYEGVGKAREWTDISSNCVQVRVVE
jgi:hypothetical protein